MAQPLIRWPLTAATVLVWEEHPLDVRTEKTLTEGVGISGLSATQLGITYDDDASGLTILIPWVNVVDGVLT